ncbi:MAG: hypothetical protein M1813_002050 [Trichoglossum hirsutum]|nr:MAG: hypothetical protein M1813_002050 [Trichoglossum hirsutum]
MDGLSAAAGVIAVIQISGRVFDLCRTYYLEVKEARKDIQRLRDEVTSLQDVLASVKDLADAPGSTKLPILVLLNKPDGPVQQCTTELEGLTAKLELKQGKDRMKQFGLRALKWPFSSRDIDKVIKNIGRHKATFNLALTADQTYVELFFYRLSLYREARLYAQISGCSSARELHSSGIRDACICSCTMQDINASDARYGTRHSERHHQLESIIYVNEDRYSPPSTSTRRK